MTGQESAKFRAAQEWLKKTQQQNWSARDAILLLADGPHHVAVLTRLVRALAANMQTKPEPPTQYAAIQPPKGERKKELLDTFARLLEELDV